MTPREMEQLADLIAARIKSEEEPKKLLLDSAGIADYLGVSERHVKAQGLPTVPMGRRRLYCPHECVEYLKEMRDGSNG